MSQQDEASVRVIFDLDENGEATGVVHPFCSDKCRDAYIPEQLPNTEYGVCFVSHFANDDLRCEQCGAQI